MVTPPDELPGAHIPEVTWRWMVYLKGKISNLEREAPMKKIEINKCAAVATKAQRELDIATYGAGKLNSVVTKLQRRLDR